MISSFDVLLQLDHQAQRGDSSARDELQTRVYPGFVVAIRRVLLTGKGNPALTNWVGSALKSLPESERADPSDALARMLCDGVGTPQSGVERGTISSAETVVELSL